MKNFEEISKYIIDQISKATLDEISLSDLDMDRQLIDDIGLDSLDFAQVMLGTEDWLGVAVPEGDIDWTALGTINLLSGFFESLQHANNK